MGDGENFDGTMILECPKCGHRWLEEFNLPMRVDVFVKRARGVDICPQCGKTKMNMLIGDKYREALKELKRSTAIL